MAYTSLPTVNAGDYWTAANHNTYVKNNFDFIATTRNIMLLAKDAQYTTDDGNADTYQRASFSLENKLEFSLSGTNVNTVTYSPDYLSFTNSATMVALWNFFPPEDFASFEKAQIYRAISTTSGNFDTKLLIRYGLSYSTDNSFTALISNSSTSLVEVDLTSFTIPADYNPNYPAQLIMIRFAASTDDTADSTLYVHGINLVYKFYTT